MTQQHSRAIRWLIVCGVLLIAAIAIGTAIMVGNFRERALVNSGRELENIVLLLARHFDQQLEGFELVQKKLVEHIHSAGVSSREDYARQMSNRDVHLLLRAKIEALAYVSGLSLIDSDGMLINSAKSWPAAPVNIADRSYFNALKSDPELVTVLSEPVLNRLTGTWTTILARKLTGPNGDFLGLVLGGIDLAQFETFLASVALGEDATITMFRRDGTMLARHPHVESVIGRSFKNAPLFGRFLSKADHVTMRLDSPIDGLDRVGSIRSLRHFPLVIVVTKTVSAMLADWREQTRFLIGAAGLFALVIVVILFLIVRQLSREHGLSQQRLALERQRLDIAINNMRQGLLLFDSSGRIIVCNQRYIAMYGLSPEVAKPGCTLHELIAHRKETGTFAGDVDDHCSAVLRRIALGKASRAITETADGRSIQIVIQPLANGGCVVTHEDTTEQRRSDARIAHLAHYDALTDLPNRTLFHQQLEQELKRVQRGEQLAVLYLDIDEFKSVNELLGQSLGDELLKAVAGRLRGCLREIDFVARLGGDEFAIIQTAIGQPTDTTDLVTRLYEAIREPFRCLGHQLAADASIGIALAPADGTDLDKLMMNADLAMRGAKADGRRTYRFFEPGMDARVKALRTLELDLRKAINDGRQELHYQPIVNLRDNRIRGCEALLRWNHPERGMISPAEFIPIAEETGLINRLGEWVLNTACAEAAAWPDDIKVAVNVSPVQFKSPALALKVASALAASGLPARRLELEITEAVLIHDDEAARAMLHQLRELGVQIALDDFGTGYSSLSYLQRFPFDKIKIDRSFIKDIAEPGGSLSIVQAVLNIATARNMTTTAEGVETQEQLELLRTHGCTEMQGYLFSRAKPAAEIVQLLSRRDRVVAVA